MGNNQQFEKISFWQLLAKKNNSENSIKKIEIPIIQRDYAQGRTKQEKIRNQFLDALYDAIYKQPVELDFVYGSETKSVFHPLDGQQRLTTLFLLHWYIATKENRLDNDVKDKLSIFTYETRTSSREFCNELVTNGIKLEKDKFISDIIKNTMWFVASWKKDPTISAMLTMLDAIHNKFSEAEDRWDKLTSDDNPPITFLYVKLENFGLSDDLYVKMNARGKQLTSFENFKSRFGRHVEKNGWEKDTTNPEDKFEHRIDTVWTDLFWKYKGDDKEIDKKLINFIAGIAINCCVENYKPTINDRIAELQDIIPINPIMDKIGKLVSSSEVIVPEDFSTKEEFDYLVNYLNKYSENNNNKIKPDIFLWNYCSEGKTLFEDLILGENFTLQKRVLFYAQTIFLLKNDVFEQNNFNDWMRLVRNVVENVSGHWNLSTMIGAIRFVKKMSEYSSSINLNLVSNENNIDSDFATKQVKQEIEKAKIIVANPKAKKTIQDTEDTNFCKGEIEFALYCADYDIDKNPNPQNFNDVKLDKIKNAITEHLNDNDVTNDFRRAFFTIQDNDFYDYWQGNLIVLDDYYYKSKRRIILDVKNLKENFSNNKKSTTYRDYLKELIEKLSQQNVDEVIEDFVKSSKFNELPRWKQRVIEEQDLLKHSEKHYIAIAEHNICCYLLPGSKIVEYDRYREHWKDRVYQIM